MGTISGKLPHPALRMDILQPPEIDEKQWKRAMIAADHAFQKDELEKMNLTTMKHHPPATSVLLQGRPASEMKNLFLFPDGSGSAASYTQLGRVASDVVVWGLNCPYLKTPADWKCSLQELTPLYLHEIRRRQPQGPYYLGGWSTGGICAFDAAQMFDREGEQVERLILIDTPCPVNLKRLPPRLMEFLKDIHAFGSNGRQPPPWLFQHFEANTKSLQKYRPRPFEAYREPATHIIWAEKGVCESEGVPKLDVKPSDPKEMRWIMCKRDDFGTLGWDKLLNDDDIHIDVVEGADHFSMMKGGGAKKLAELLGSVME